MKYSCNRKLLCKLTKLSKLNAFIFLGYYRRTLMHLFLFTNSAQRELVSIRRVYTTAINFPCITSLVLGSLGVYSIDENTSLIPPPLPPFSFTYRYYIVGYKSLKKLKHRHRYILRTKWV